MKIAHIINPVNVLPSSDLFDAQPVTFSTMHRAKEYSVESNAISLYVLGYPEDEVVFPAGFTVLPSLSRSVMDVNLFQKSRKLPLIGDILKSLESLDVDYIVYTNVDIAVLPFFYDYIKAKIKAGSDSLIINRRVLNELQDDNLMFAEIGQDHPGYDCFVFRKELLSKFVLNDICIGANWIGRAFYANLVAFSRSVEVIKDAHLTFHIGEDGAWLLNDFSEFDVHNKAEAQKVIGKLLKLPLKDTARTDIEEVKVFMDTYGIHPQSQPSLIVRKPFIYRLKKRVKKIIKAFYQ